MNTCCRYTALYNAECDKPNPRPVSELIRQLEREEKVLALQKLPVIILRRSQLIGFQRGSMIYLCRRNNF